MEALRGVGPALAGRLAKLSLHTIGDLASHLPRSYQDRRRMLLLSEVSPGHEACVRASVVRLSRFSRRGRSVSTATITDPEGGIATLYAFGRPQLSQTLETGQEILIYGRFDLRGSSLSSSSFELTGLEEAEAGSLVPIYPGTAGLSQRVLRRLIQVAVAAGAPATRFHVPEDLVVERNMPDKSDALVRVHRPRTFEEAEEARKALAYEEFFQLQLTLAKRSPAGRVRPQRRSRGKCLQEELLKRLPYVLTKSQQAALSEIEADLCGGYTSARLLQGDVGCGKTLVALLATARVVESGQQAAIVAPSEALCFQHAETAARLLEPIGIRLGLLSGSTDRAARAQLLTSLAAGDIDVLLSTHAVLEDSVVFSELGLVVIDEQQKFGVVQRASVAAKAVSGDLIMMTATPIPRTLALTLYGDLSVTSIDQQPPGRQKIRTHLVEGDNRERVYNIVESELDRGRQAYFVCPKVGNTDAASDRFRDIQTMAEEDLYLFPTDVRAESDVFEDSAVSLYSSLKCRFSRFKVGLAHGGLDAAKQRNILGAFHSGAIDVLVATTVVEVGLDVSNATCMVVEHAERFGLTALHQLRGRVGRGSEPSHAFFIYSRDIKPQAVERLRAIKDHSDGFKLAEIDLSLRGPGELAGTRQAGLPPLRAARLSSDIDLMRRAQADARRYQINVCVGKRVCG